ncbi:ABC-type nitrate/sulfonate/bicarbonate transport system, substrate-binding protein [Lachnospiraceae bacterium XBB1006]|nr:ABC-type nitrate/sulfonate/bicarbonate transport system, substrate-binding protein [Lachnospiraceae bacterium XBB1006]
MKRRMFAVLLVMVMALSLAACGKSDSGNKTDAEKKAEEKETKELKNVTFVLDWTPNTNHTGVYVAIEKGFYEDAGLKVKVVQPPEDGAAVLVASGGAQFGVDFQDYLVPAFSGDNQLPVTAVAGIIQHNTSGIVSLKGNGITSPKGMCGKKYATWELEIEQAMLKYLVEKDGGDFKDVTMIPSTVTDVASALSTKEVDDVWIYYAWDGIALEQKGIASDFFFFKDYDEALDYYSPVIIANDDYLKDCPEETKAFLQATKKGYEYAMKHPKEAADILVKAAPELDKEIVVKSQEWLKDQYQADAPYWGYIDEKRWDAFYDWLYENGVVKEKIPHGTGFSNDYLQE